MTSSASDRSSRAEQAVVLETDPTRAREIARAHLAMYLQLPNYANSIMRVGFDEPDLADGGSDRLVDRLVAWGDESAIAARVQEHRDAGADHVCLQVLTGDPWRFPATSGGALLLRSAERSQLAPRRRTERVR